MHRSFDWPGFRGAAADGVSPETGVFSKRGSRLEVAWKKPLGKGYSGIAVAGDTVVTMFSDGASDVVAGFDNDTGTQRWRFSLGETYRGHDGSQDGPISTPYVYADRVFALGPRGTLYALALADGREIWSADLVEQYGASQPHWGFGTSPIVMQDVLVIQAGAPDGMVYGLNPDTGQRLWTSGKDSVYYQSPVPFSYDGRPLLLAAGNSKIACLEPRSGNVVWEYAHEGSGEYGSICLVPVPVGTDRIFLKHKDDAAVVIQPAVTDGEDVHTVVWESPAFRKSYTVPVAVDGYLYGFNGRTLACVDADSGATAWRSRPPGDGFPIAVDGHLIVLCKAGTLSIVRAGAGSFFELARMTDLFDDLAWSPPAFADGAIYARSFGEIARVDIRPSDMAFVTAEPAWDLSGTRFGRFLDELHSADHKSKTIDKFLAEAGPFPLIESDDRVVFVYRGPGRELAIGGDLTGFGSKLSMRRVPDTDLFYAVATLEPDARICYAFIRDFRAVPDALNSNRAKLRGVDEELEFEYTGGEQEVSWLAMPAWKPPRHFNEVKESRRGRVIAQSFSSEAMGKQVAFSVYLPAGYDASRERLPVVYLHGGRVVSESLEIPRSLDNLIGSTVAPLIAVSIDEPAPFMGLEKYCEMCGRELAAFIDEHYRTVVSRDGRAHVGWGFAAQAAVQTALVHADRVGKFGVQSPFILSPTYIEPFMKQAANAPFDVYIDWGKYDTRSPLDFWDVSAFGRQLADYFRRHGYEPAGGQFHEGGDIPAWRNRTDDLLQFLFPLPEPD